MFEVNNKDTGYILVTLLLNLNIYTPCSSVFTVNFEDVIAGWASYKKSFNFSIWLVVNNIAFVLAVLNARLLFKDQVSMFESSIVSI